MQDRHRKFGQDAVGFLGQVFSPQWYSLYKGVIEKFVGIPFSSYALAKGRGVGCGCMAFYMCYIGGIREVRENR